MSEQYGIITVKAANIIMTDHPRQVATAVPIGIEEQVLFVMDQEKVGHYTNALADSIGSWRQNGTELHYV